MRHLIFRNFLRDHRNGPRVDDEAARPRRNQNDRDA